ncbi:hypothetical protein BN130_1689 [Cronobacter malonaticus 507]|nr:hypothetical protein BN130_1689 [Cronobacter malonaticus 507]
MTFDLPMRPLIGEETFVHARLILALSSAAFAAATLASA